MIGESNTGNRYRMVLIDFSPLHPHCASIKKVIIPVSSVLPVLNFLPVNFSIHSSYSNIRQHYIIQKKGEEKLLPSQKRIQKTGK